MHDKLEEQIQTLATQVEKHRDRDREELARRHDELLLMISQLIFQVEVLQLQVEQAEQEIKKCEEELKQLRKKLPPSNPGGPGEPRVVDLLKSRLGCMLDEQSEKYLLTITQERIDEIQSCLGVQS